MLARSDDRRLCPHQRVSLRRVIDAFIENMLVTIGINIILATGLNLIIGFSGQFSLGHAGFMQSALTLLESFYKRCRPPLGSLFRSSSALPLP